MAPGLHIPSLTASHQTTEAVPPVADAHILIHSAPREVGRQESHAAASISTYYSTVGTLAPDVVHADRISRWRMYFSDVMPAMSAGLSPVQQHLRYTLSPLIATDLPSPSSMVTSHRPSRPGEMLSMSDINISEVPEHIP